MSSSSRKRKARRIVGEGFGYLNGGCNRNVLEKPREEYHHKDLYPDLKVSKPLSIYYSGDDDGGSINGNAAVNDKPKPSYRRFEDQHHQGEDYTTEKAMIGVGYTQSDEFEMPDSYIRGFVSQNDPALGNYSFGGGEKRSSRHKSATATPGRSIRVEYDMDEQDERFLELFNQKRKNQSLDCISKELFEVTMTLLETEWFILERRMPPKKRNNANASNNETTPTEEQRCIICDESECDNSNAIVFCDGCDIAVHQECYGVPFIPEGQWLCNKCTISPKHTVSCVFCPNEEPGAFKPTDTNHWVHALCSLWIPEVSVKYPIYMEPVTGLTRIPRGRWKLCCYICKCRVGACIQCANKSCFQAFHPACARRASLYMKMTMGAFGAINDPGTLFSYCDNHTPLDHKHSPLEVKAKVRESQAHFAQTLNRYAYSGNEWERLFKNQSSIKQNVKYVRKTAPGSLPWRTEQGTPVIPSVIVEKIYHVMTKFHVMKLREFIQQMCRYWALKRQMKRGAALSKRLQLALEVDPNQQLTQDEAASKLQRYEGLLENLEKLRVLTDQVKQREELKYKVLERQQSIVNLVYFPIIYFISPLWTRIVSFGKTHPESLDTTTMEGIEQKIKSQEYKSVAEFGNDFEMLISLSNRAEYEKPLARLHKMLFPMVDRARKKYEALPTDPTTDLPDFKNFMPDGVHINDQELWTGDRLRREMSPLTDLDDEELERLETNEPRKRQRRTRSSSSRT